MNLKKILGIASSSCAFYITKYIVNFLENNLLPHWMDGFGNIYITKGESDIYPCITAHLDTVHGLVPPNITERNGQLTSNEGIGGDDKVGIFIALSLLKKLDVLKVVFFTGEESGCTGSVGCDKDFLKNIGYIMVADRRGNSDYVNNYFGAKTTSRKFDKRIKRILYQYNYESADGMITDVFNLLEEGLTSVASCNLSCGYYLPHTKGEYVVIKEVYQTLELMYKMINALGNKKYMINFSPDSDGNWWESQGYSKDFYEYKSTKYKSDGFDWKDAYYKTESKKEYNKENYNWDTIEDRVLGKKAENELEEDFGINEDAYGKCEECGMFDELIEHGEYWICSSCAFVFKRTE